MFPLVSIILLKARAAILSLIVFYSIAAKKKVALVVLSIFSIIAISQFISLRPIIDKWDEGAKIGSGRFGPWIHYIGKLQDDFPRSLFPYSFRNSMDSEKLNDYLGTDGLLHSSHNLFIDLLYISILLR